MDYLQKRKKAGRKPEKRRNKTASGEGAGLMERGKATLYCYHFSVLKRKLTDLLLYCFSVLKCRRWPGEVGDGVL